MYVAKSLTIDDVHDEDKKNRHIDSTQFFINFVANQKKDS